MNTPRGIHAIVQEELAHLKARLQWREDDIRLAAAEAIMDGDELKASALLPTIRELVVLRNAIGLHFPISIDAKPTPSITPTLSRPAPTAVIGYKVFGLRTFLTGVKIEGRTDACTFADAIQAIGCQAIADLRLAANHCALVSREHQRPPFGMYRRRMQIRQRGEWYIVTHSSTARKAELLREIARRLKVDLVVETSWMTTK